MLQISQKTFLLAGLALFFIVSGVLFTLHNRALDPTRNGDWWALRFVSLENQESLAFEVENYTSVSTATYKIIMNGNVVEEKMVSINPDTVTSITPEITHKAGVPTRIVVKLGDTEQFLSR